jgi:hypothetical protein
VPYEINYLGELIEGTIYPSDDPSIEIRHDIHAPTISEVTSGSDWNRPRLSISVSDSGTYPSGLDISSMQVTYNEGQTGEGDWHSAVVFTTAKDVFTAEFPEMEANTIVNFKIEIKDQVGNLAELDGKFTTIVAQNPQNQTVNNTQNTTNTQPEDEQEQGIPLLYIISGVILLFLVIYFVFHIKTKAAGGVS